MLLTLTDFTDVHHLIVIGHPLGGGSVIEPLADLLARTSQNIDLDIPPDSTGLGDDLGLLNILKAINC